MAQTIPDIEITEDWKNIEVLTNGAITEGSAFNIQNKENRGKRIIWAEGTEPTPESTDGGVIYADGENRVANFDAGSLMIWFRTYSGEATAHAELA